MSVYNINPFCFQTMNNRRTIIQRRVGEAVVGNQVPSQVPARGVVMPFNPAGFTARGARFAEPYGTGHHYAGPVHD